MNNSKDKFIGYYGPDEESPYFDRIFPQELPVLHGEADKSHLAEQPLQTDSMSQVDQMADLESQNLTIVDSDDLSFTGKHRIAFLDGGQAYILNLLPAEAEDVLALAPGSIQFPKSEVIDQSPDDQSGSIRHCFVYPPSEDPPENVSLDDEQARAVASLLEFHNQMTSPFSSNKTSANNNANGTASGDVIISGTGTSQLQCRIQEYQEQEQIFPHSSAEIGMDPLAIDELKRPPIKTYSRRGRNHVEVPLQAVQSFKKAKQEPNTAPRFQVAPTMTNQKSSSSVSTAPPDLHIPRRKRRCVMDAVKVIPTREFRQQLQDTSDIVQKKIDCAPPTKKAMHYLTYGGVGKFFAHPGRKVMSAPLAKLFFSRLTMTTEPKSNSSSADSVIKPLTSDLRVPKMSESDQQSNLQSSSTPVSTSMFNESVAKRTAMSFDNFCKGMTKPPKYEYKRKKKPEQTDLGTSDAPTPNVHIVSLKTDDNSNSTMQTVSFVPVTTSDSTVVKTETETIPVEISDSETTGNHIVCTFQNDEIEIKDEIDHETSEIFVEGSQETEGVHSNFEMLIAAAEQHNNLPPASDTNALEESGEVRIMEFKEEEDEDGNKTEVVYCTNCTNEEMEQVIFVGTNGERYRFTTSTQGELTIWPEPECDTN